MLIQSSKRFTSDNKFQQMRVLDSLAHIFETLRNSLDVTDRLKHRDYYPDLHHKCVGSFKSRDRTLRDWTRKSNRLQMLEQRQHLLLNNFNALSVDSAGNRTQASRRIEWHLIN